MAKQVTEYGRRWNALTPRTSIKYYVNNLHVSVSDADIRDEISRRIAKARETDPRWTEAIERQSIAYALLVHKRNKGLFCRVMRVRAYCNGE